MNIIKSYQYLLCYWPGSCAVRALNHSKGMIPDGHMVCKLKFVIENLVCGYILSHESYKLTLQGVWKCLVVSVINVFCPQ